MKWKGWEQLKANEKKGVSMVVMLCVSAFFIAFATAILYTAGLLTAQSTQRLKQERCYQLAKSYAQVLETELQKTEQKNDPANEGTFYSFANRFLDESRYAEYDEDNADATEYQYIVQGTQLSDITTNQNLPESYGNISVIFRKEKNADVRLAGTISLSGNRDDYAGEINRLSTTSVRQYVFTVEVTAYYEDETYTYTTEYAREETYDKLKFSHNGTEIVWDAANKIWRVNNESGAEYSFGDSTEPIDYEYLTSNPATCKYVNIITEGGK